jgi:hypothetical protein
MKKIGLSLSAGFGKKQGLFVNRFFLLNKEFGGPSGIRTPDPLIKSGSGVYEKSITYRFV